MLNLRLSDKRTSPPPAAQATQHTTGVDAQPFPILIVEDDAGMRMMLLLALEDAGYTVELAANGAEALDALTRMRPSLILLDLRMPVMDGATFLRHVHAAGKRNAPPIVVMTAYRDIEPEVAQYGLPTVTKPMQLDQLVTLIERHKR